jgi:hypothetical protein
MGGNRRGLGGEGFCNGRKVGREGNNDQSGQKTLDDIESLWLVLTRN